MKKLVFFCIIGILAAFPLFAEEKKEVSLRFSHRDNIMRVVLESDDTSIKSATIVSTLSQIKIEFPALFQFTKLKDFPFETAVKDRFLILSLKNVEDIKSYRLAGPPRIVIDLTIAVKAEQGLPAQTGKKDGPVQEQKPGHFPEKPAGPKVFFLDAGHGGYDFGLLGKDAKEKDLNLLFTKDLGTALANKGNRAFQTRKVDQSLPIFDRIMLVNSKKTDVFISVHSSASNSFAIYTALADDPPTEPAVTLYSLAARQSRHREKSRALARAIGEALKGEFKKDVYLREMPLPILNSMDAPAVLIEYPSLQLNSYDQKLRDRFATAVVNGILAYE